ncbi:MAG: GAF domain-containing protein [Chloroflexi bacterium]|nr:GAF domain-containing protein [Chloroflexota bacterium]
MSIVAPFFVWDEARQVLETVAHENKANPDKPGRHIGLGTLTDWDKLPIVRQMFTSQEVRQLVYSPTQSAEEHALLDMVGLQSLLLVPLVWRDRFLGLLGLGLAEEARAFETHEIRLTKNLANQAAVALDHARLFAQAQQRIEELSAFQKIALQINSPLALREVLNTIGESALRLVTATNLHIYLYDADRQTFGYGLALWRDGHQVPIAPPRPDGLTATVVRNGQPMVINHAQEHPLFLSQGSQMWEVQAIAGFPLKRGEQIIGAFTAAYLHEHTFSDDELILLNLLADQAAVAVHNANLFDNLQHQLQAMSALVDMAQQVTGKLELGSVMQTTVEVLQRLLDARASSISLLHDDELVIEAAVGIKPEFLKKRMKLGQGVSGQAVQERQAIYQRDTQEDPNFLFFDKTVRSLLAVPLIHRDTVLGTLTIDSDLPNGFDEQDAQLMTVAAAQVSVAIANANFVREIQEHAEELSLAYEELKESDRLKDELVQNVSHELRTPLTFVKGYVDLLMDGEMGLLTDEQRAALQIVSTKTSEITRLIEDIVTLQRIEEGNLEPTLFSLGDLVRLAVAGHKLNVKFGVNLLITAIQPIPEGRIYADKGRITQVLDNLVANAIKFSPDGGTVFVEVRETANEVLMIVSDQGIGVPQDKLDRIFDRFYQVDGSSKRRFGGTGIGLALVKRIIEAHKGRVWVTSELKKGSSFYVALPKAG